MPKKQYPELICPKCNKPYKRKQSFNSQFVVYKHKQKKGCWGMSGLIDFCVVYEPKSYEII